MINKIIPTILNQENLIIFIITIIIPTNSQKVFFNLQDNFILSFSKIESNGKIKNLPILIEKNSPSDFVRYTHNLASQGNITPIIRNSDTSLAGLVQLDSGKLK